MKIPESDRRIVPDRRKQITRIVNKYSFIGGRRRTIRREEDRKKYLFVDWYSPGLLVALLLLLTLSFLDAYFTLVIMRDHNLREVNPFMALYLKHGEMSFIIGKFLITSVSIFIFGFFNKFFIVKFFLAVSIIIYLAVVTYELNVMYKIFAWLS